MKPIWGIDLGGTKIEGTILRNANQTETISRLRIPTEREKGYDHIIQNIGRLIEMLKEDSGLIPQKVGIGTPGTIDPPTQLMKNSNTTVLNGQPFHKDLEAYLKLPITMANDANCFAIAEAKLGIVAEKTPHAKVVFGVIMGTGVGGGVVVNGQILGGAQGIGGEWGHSFLDSSGEDCYCGNHGCVETIISGPALERYYKKISGKSLRLKEIIQLHLNGKDKDATVTIERLIHFYGRGIANLINILDPDVIIIGGGVGNIDLLYNEGRAAVQKFVFNTRLDTQILKPKLGDSAGVFGAALLVAED